MKISRADSRFGDVKVFRRFGDWLRPHLQGVAGSLVVPKADDFPSNSALNHQHTLNMGKELAPETSETLYILTRLSVRENLIK